MDNTFDSTTSPSIHEYECEVECTSLSTPTQDRIDDILSNDQMRQLSGCRLLAHEMSINSFRSCETSMNKVIESGIIPRLISFTLHNKQESAQCDAFSVIASIAPLALQSIANHGCIESIIKCLSSRSHNERMWLQNERMTHSSLSILSHLSGPFRDDVLSEGAVPIVMALLFKQIPSSIEYGYAPDAFIKHARFISAILSNLCYGEHDKDVYYLVDMFKALQYLIKSEDFEILRNTIRGLKQLVKLRDTYDLDPDHPPPVDTIMNHHSLLFDGFIRENIKSLKVKPSNDLLGIISNYHSVFVCSINDNIIIPRLCKLLCHKSDEIKLLAIGILMKVITGNTKQYLFNELITKYNLIEYIGNVLKINYPESSNVIMSRINDLFLHVFLKCIQKKSIVQQLSDLLVTASQTNSQIIHMFSCIVSNENDQTILKVMIQSEIIRKLLKEIADSDINQEKDIWVFLQTITNLRFIENEEIRAMVTKQMKCDESLKSLNKIRSKLDFQERICFIL